MISDILEYKVCSDAEISNLIGIFSSNFQSSSHWSIEQVDIKQIIPLCKHVYRERLEYAEHSITKCLDNDIPLFFPYVAKYKNGKQHLIVPPIVEERNHLLYLGDGMHRIYKMLEFQIPTAYVLMTHNCTLPFPGNPQSWNNVKEAEVQLPASLNFENFLREGLTGYSKFCNSEFFWNDERANDEL